MVEAYDQCTLYCGNLDPSVVAKELQELLACEFVELHRCPKSFVNFAFATFKTSAEATKVLEIKDGIYVKGKRLALSQRDHFTSHVASPQPCNLYVRKLKHAVDGSALHQAFQQLGGVVSIKIPNRDRNGRHKGYAFVQMESREAAEHAIHALNGDTHLGFPSLVVTYSIPYTKGSSSSSEGSSITKVNTNTTAKHENVTNTDDAIKDAADSSPPLTRGLTLEHSIVNSRCLPVSTSINSRKSEMESSPRADVNDTVSPSSPAQAEKLSTNNNNNNNNADLVDDKPKSSTADNNKVINQYNKISTANNNRAGIEAEVTIAPVAVAAAGAGSNKHHTKHHTNNTASHPNARYYKENTKGSSTLSSSSSLPSLPHHQQQQQHYHHLQRGEGIAVSCTVYVRPIPEAMEELGLMESFLPYGTIIATKILRNIDGSSRGAGFVEFASREEAEYAMTCTHGTPAMGRTFKCSWAERPLHVSVAMGSGGVTFVPVLHPHYYAPHVSQHAQQQQQHGQYQFGYAHPQHAQQQLHMHHPGNVPAAAPPLAATSHGAVVVGRVTSQSPSPTSPVTTPSAAVPAVFPPPSSVSNANTGAIGTTTTAESGGALPSIQVATVAPAPPHGSSGINIAAMPYYAAVPHHHMAYQQWINPASHSPPHAHPQMYHHGQTAAAGSYGSPNTHSSPPGNGRGLASFTGVHHPHHHLPSHHYVYGYHHPHQHQHQQQQSYGVVHSHQVSYSPPPNSNYHNEANGTAFMKTHHQHQQQQQNLKAEAGVDKNGNANENSENSQQKGGSGSGSSFSGPCKNQTAIVAVHGKTTATNHSGSNNKCGSGSGSPAARNLQHQYPRKKGTGSGTAPSTPVLPSPMGSHPGTPLVHSARSAASEKTMVLRGVLSASELEEGQGQGTTIPAIHAVSPITAGVAAQELTSKELQEAPLSAGKAAALKIMKKLANQHINTNALNTVMAKSSPGTSPATAPLAVAPVPVQSVTSGFKAQRPHQIHVSAGVGTEGVLELERKNSAGSVGSCDTEALADGVLAG